jgi:hypothetical protein
VLDFSILFGCRLETTNSTHQDQNIYTREDYLDIGRMRQSKQVKELTDAWRNKLPDMSSSMSSRASSVKNNGGSWPPLQVGGTTLCSNKSTPHCRSEQNLLASPPHQTPGFQTSQQTGAAPAGTQCWDSGADGQKGWVGDEVVDGDGRCGGAVEIRVEEKHTGSE